MHGCICQEVCTAPALLVFNDPLIDGTACPAPWCQACWRPYLFKHERDPNKGHTMVQAFIHTVQPAVRHKGTCVGMPKHVLFGGRQQQSNQQQW